MRILHAVRTVDPASGGPFEAMLNFASAHLEAGHSVEVFSLDDPAAACVRQAPFPVHALGPGRGGYGYSPRAQSFLKGSAERWDAVIVHGLWQFHGWAVWRAFRRAQTPYFVFPHGMLDPWFRTAYPAKHLKKQIYWWAFERHILRGAKAVLYTGEEERRLARPTFFPYACREAIAPLGIAPPPPAAAGGAAAFLDRWPELAGRRWALFFGRLHPKKGIDLLIAGFAASAPNPLQLVIAGPDEGGYRGTLEAQAARLGLGHRITFTGLLRGDLKWGALQSAEIFILPSHQ
jgi:glycosyltransferase involved in cell wall biosynthesis